MIIAKADTINASLIPADFDFIVLVFVGGSEGCGSMEYSRIARI